MLGAQSPIQFDSILKDIKQIKQLFTLLIIIKIENTLLSGFTSVTIKGPYAIEEAKSTRYNFFCSCLQTLPIVGLKELKVEGRLINILLATW